jgi:hypothetical protein
MMIPCADFAVESVSQSSFVYSALDAKDNSIAF